MPTANEKRSLDKKVQSLMKASVKSLWKEAQQDSERRREIIERNFEGMRKALDQASADQKVEVRKNELKKLMTKVMRPKRTPSLSQKEREKLQDTLLTIRDALGGSVHE